MRYAVPSSLILTAAILIRTPISAICYVIVRNILKDKVIIITMAYLIMLDFYKTWVSNKYFLYKFPSIAQYSLYDLDQGLAKKFLNTVVILQIVRN